jgi:organic radical activating enzyme
MNIFGKDVKIKNYNCSADNVHYINIPEKINLYVQTTDKCPAHCDWCKLNIADNFDLSKYETVLKELVDKDVLERVYITGGEPLLNMNLTTKIIEMSKLYSEDVRLNTNAYDINRLKDIYDMIPIIYISKHHYDNKINDQIMGIRTPSLKEIRESLLYTKTIINCVLQKRGINSLIEMKKMLEELTKYDIKIIKFISLLPLNDVCFKEMVNVEEITNACEIFLNDGYLYDKSMCKCFEFMYISSMGKTVTATIRNTLNANYDCVKHLVYDGKHLYDGFKKENNIF